MPRLPFARHGYDTEIRRWVTPPAQQTGRLISKQNFTAQTELTDFDRDPLSAYQPCSFVWDSEPSDPKKALDAAILFTSTIEGPVLTTPVSDALEDDKHPDVWWREAYIAACQSVERTIQDALMADADSDGGDDRV